MASKRLIADRKRRLGQIIWNEWSKGKTADIRAAVDGFVMDSMPFKAQMKSDAQDASPFVYSAEGKAISFKPSGMWWTTPGGDVLARSPQASQGKLVGGRVKYAGALGKSVDIEISTAQNMWRKEVVIRSLASLGKIPETAEYLEIVFEIETDFDLEWDGVNDLQFDTSIQLSELSRLNPITAYSRGGEVEQCAGFLRAREGKKYLVKQIPVDYLKQAVYPLVTDASITYGAEYVFNTATADLISCAVLDSTHFVVGYRDGGNSSYGTAIIGAVSSGDQIAYGAAYVFNAANTSSLSVSVLDATHFAVVYDDAFGGGRSKIGVVSLGDQIAYGAEYTFNTVYTSYISCAALDSTHFVVGYRDESGDDDGHAKIGVVSSGDQIAYGAEYTFNAADTNHISCAALDATHFVVGYKDDGGIDYGCAKIGVVASGDQIAYGAEYVFNSENTERISCAALDSTHFVVGYAEVGGGFTYLGKSVIGVVSSGDQIAYGAEYTFNAASTNYISCASLDSTHFVISYMDAGNSNYGTAIIGTVSSGDQIAYGAEYVFNAASTLYVSCAVLDSTHFVVGYRDGGNSSYGTAIVGSLPVAPTVTTQAATIIVPGGATLNGNITADGGASISEHGFCWKAGADPVNIAGADGNSTLGAGVEGAFSQAKTGLTENTLYYYRGYATNTEGTGYGGAVSWTTGETLAGAVSISAVPSMTIDGDLVASAVLSISAVASMVLDGDLIASGIAAISAVPSMTITPLRKRLGVASINAVPSMTIDGDLVASGVVSINAVPSLTIDGDLIASAVVAIAAVASVAADANLIASGAVAIAVVASLIAKASNVYYESVMITVVPSMTAAGNVIASGAVSIESIASLAVLATKIVPGSCSIQAVTSLVALADRVRYAEASISTSAALTVAAQLIASGAVDIEAVASMTLDGDAIRGAIASIQSVASMTATPLRIRPGAVDIEAVPSVTIDGALIASAVAAIEAVASLSADPLRIREGACTIDSVASLSADGDVIRGAIVSIAIASSLVASGQLIASGEVSIEAVASLVASSVTVKSGEVTITSNSSLTAAALAYITQSLGYTGTLVAGDVLEIDTDKMTVKLNGVNAREAFTGTFPLLYGGTNELRWEDDDGSRDADLESKHSPRYL